MRKLRFAIETPPGTWMSEVSSSFPETEFRLLTGITVGEAAIELGEITGAAVGEAAAAFEAHPDIGDHEELYAGTERVLAKYRTTERSLYGFLREASVPPEFPVVVADGRATFEVTATREQVRELHATLEGAPLAYEVLAVAGDDDPETLLTARQRELLDIAMREGYYAVPRECALADVAAAAGVDESTASGVLRRGEARLVRWFLTGSGHGTETVA